MKNTSVTLVILKMLFEVHLQTSSQTKQSRHQSDSRR